MHLHGMALCCNNCMHTFGASRRPDNRCFYLNNFKDDVVVPLMKGMANVTLSTGSIKQIKVVLPSIDDQEKLVALMEKCERLRDTLLKSMTDAELMIKAVLSEIVGTKWMENIQ